MIIRHTTRHHLDDALQLVNERFEGNVMFRDIKMISHSLGYGESWRVTLRVSSSKGPGHRLAMERWGGGKQHRLTAACWHVHGKFFDFLLTINPEAVILTEVGREKRKPIFKDKESGRIQNNWMDAEVGSMMYPALLGDLCECEERERVKSRMVRQENLTAECWTVQVWGLGTCEECEAKDTDECGGQEIRKTGKNEKGMEVPV